MFKRVIAVLIELCCAMAPPAFAAGPWRSDGRAPPQAANDAPGFTEVRRAVHAGSTTTMTPYVADADRWDRHRFDLLSAPASGSASVTADGKALVYAAPAAPGVDSFAYRATDRGGLAVEGGARMVVYGDTTLSTCRQDSTVTPAGVLDQRTKSNGCAFYGQTSTRATADGTPVTVDYFVNGPASGSASKAVVVLIGGGDLNMAIRGNPATGVGDVTGGANNFVVRTAQLFADAGYLTVALDRPVPGPAAPAGSADALTATDLYRVSVDHAIDILAVLKTVNTDHLPVFLVGTSRGSLSVVAQNRIAAGIATSSSLTSDAGDNGRRLYLGRPDTPNLLPQFVRRPTHVLRHADDGCPVTSPAASRALFDSLVAAGVDAALDTASGGVRVTAAGNGVSPDICGALSFHGYMGIENTAVGYITTWLDQRVAALGGGHGPKAAFAEVATAAGTPRRIHLDALTRDPGCWALTSKCGFATLLVPHGGRPALAGLGALMRNRRAAPRFLIPLGGRRQRRLGALSYDLPGTATSLGGLAVLTGRTVTYTPPPGVSSGTDRFVYVATDGHGGVAAAVVSVRIGG